MSWNHRNFARVCALPAAAGIVVLAAGAASAHVTISPSEGAAGSYTVLTASVPHGCDGSPTTKVAIKMPEQILSVTPTRNPLWNVQKVMQKLDEPVTDAHGNELTERVGQVVYTAKTPLPDGYRDAFELSLQVPDAVGETLVFPVIQTCEKGKTAWVETAADGNTEELEAPAPTLTVLPAEEEAAPVASPAADASPASDESATETDTAAQASDAADDDGDSDALGIAALVAGLLGLAAGVGALVQVRRRS
jgi:uncharacterized protein YcnI